jgi:heme iron utilization protein
MRDAHARPAGASTEPLYDLQVATPTHAERARTLVESIAVGTLCTLAREPAGHPYGSLVTFGVDAGRPVFLISELAEHTKNLHADRRASLLVAEAQVHDPLANGRVTLLGECAVVTAAEREAALRAYLGRFPDGAGYADFKDFALWALEVSSARYIGGYGRMSWVSAADWAGSEPDPIAPDAHAILEHMNEDHADALPLYCRAFSRAGEVTSARMTGIDRYGFEMSARTPEGPRPMRLAFPKPIASKADARTALVALLHEARAKLGSKAAEPRAEEPGSN